MKNIKHDVDYEYLLKLRLVVARCGEMDHNCWWNTKGVLGNLGDMALSRGLPKSHTFASSRIVFTVAKNRCDEVFSPSNCITLWKLIPSIEEAFNSLWQTWILNTTKWQSFLKGLEQLNKENLLDVLHDLTLIEEPLIEATRKLRRSAEGRAVQISSRGIINHNLTFPIYTLTKHVSLLKSMPSS